MGPLSWTPEFILRGRGCCCGGTFVLGSSPLHAPTRGCTFRGTYVTTGSLAVRSSGERWLAPCSGGECYSPWQCWPAGGPRNLTRLGRGPRLVPGRAFDLPGLLAVLADRARLGHRALPCLTQGLWRIGRFPIRPVLEHGPRSLTCAQVMGSYET